MQSFDMSEPQAQRYLRLIPKTVRYLKKNGLRRTVSRVRSELNKNARFYPALTPARTAGEVKRVSFLVGCLEGESKRYRVYNVVEGLRQKGIDSFVFHETNLGQLEQALSSDILTVFRAGMSETVGFVIENFKQNGIPVVYDVDDLIFEPNSIGFFDGIRDCGDEQRGEYLSGIKRLREVLDRCDFATCPTEYLANRIQSTNKKAFVVPNTVDRAQYELAERLLRNRKSRDGRVRIGYFSGTKTHDADFLEAADALSQVLLQYGNTDFHVVGPLDLPKEVSRFGNRIIRKQFMPYLAMLEHLSTMDINIAPLEQNNPYTEGKSELKIFEAGIVAVPTVASRVDSYARCISDGRNGFLAGSKKEWLDKLSLLVEDEEIRLKMGVNARTDFTNTFYVGNAIEGIVKVYDQIVRTHRERSAVRTMQTPYRGAGGS